MPRIQGSSYQNELDRFFQILSNNLLTKRNVTKAALTKSRKKIGHQAFIELNRRLIHFFTNILRQKPGLDFA